MNRNRINLLLAALCLGAVPLLSGCPIPSDLPGKGKELHRTCRADGRTYWLYVPENHNSERRYPLVVTLHGMKPYDVAYHHVKMWGALADKYGYLVLAPELQTSDSFGQFPLRRMGEAELNDAKHILACINEVATDWEVDRGSVLLSSWSMGGYLAHYMVGEHGDMFTAFAPLQSNFCNEVLNAARARRWAGRLPIFMFYGTADLPVVTNETKESIEWYKRLGYHVQYKKAGVGHQRHPELAAQFFEAVMTGRPKNLEIVVTPPKAEAAPLAVNLWPALSSKIGEVRSFVWDFGRLSAAPSYQKSPNVLIRQPGEYPITLTVVDRYGNRHVASTKLTVPAAASARRPNGQYAPTP